MKPWVFVIGRAEVRVLSQIAKDRRFMLQAVLMSKEATLL